MRRKLARRSSVFAAVVATAALWSAPQPNTLQNAPAGHPTDLAATLSSTRTPVAFVKNDGQWRGAFSYRAQFGAVTAFLEERGWMLSLAEKLPAPRRLAQGPRGVPNDEPLRGAAVRMRFSGADAPTLVAGEPRSGVHHYFLGNDPERWRTDVAQHDAVTYRGLYPGIDVKAYDKGGRFEYDLLLQPGTELSRVAVDVEGASQMRLEADGTLVFDTPVGQLRQPRPTTFALDASGTRREVACGYELRGAMRFGFVATDWNGEDSLLVDPGLLYSTFVGGSASDSAQAITVDAAGVVTIAGETQSPDYPVTAGAWNTTYNASQDGFVTRLDPSRPPAQQLVYSTFFGGSNGEFVAALAVDATGAATIAGYTGSADYPTTPGAWDTTPNGNYDTVITRLDPSRAQAQQLVYSTYVGGSGQDLAHTMAVDPLGVVTLAGETSSSDYPTTSGAWDTTYNINQDGFVTRLDPALPPAQQLVYSTFIGGSNHDSVRALTIDQVGVVTLVGSTGSAQYPTTPNAWNRLHNAPSVSDAFVTRLDMTLPRAQQLVYSTFLGGVSNDQATALVVDVTGVVTVAGFTSAADYPTTSNAWDRTYDNSARNGSPDVFVTRLDPTLPAAQQMVYSTFIGGMREDGPSAIAVDSAGTLTIAGVTTSLDYPTTPGAWDSTNSDRLRAFVTRLDVSRPAPQQLVYSTFVGGSLSVHNAARCLTVDGAGVVTIAGYTESTNYPTTPNAWSRTYSGGGADAVLTRLDMLPTGVTRHGTSTAGCNGQLAASVTSMPRIGNATFALTCTNAPPFSVGVVALATGRLQTPARVLGIDLWLDPTTIWLPASVNSDSRGAADLPLPLPRVNRLVGLTLYGQFLWLGPNAPTPCPPQGFSATAALEITIQL